MLNWNSIDHDRQRRETLRREAEAARLAASPKRKQRLSPPQRAVVAWTGRRLVTLGFSLLVHAREWDYRSNTVYNGAKSSAQIP